MIIMSSTSGSAKKHGELRRRLSHAFGPLKAEKSDVH